MIQVIPNWHPVFVHFTVALLSLSVFFSIIVKFLRDGTLKEQWQILASWNLWLGTAFGIVTALAGWYAYNTVMHDAPSHAAMTVHFYWALATLAVFVLLSAWSVWNLRMQGKSGVLFAVLLLAGGVLLMSTAWHGGELVYRYGLGVMSLPQATEEGDGDGHAHVQDAVSVVKPAKPITAAKEMKPHTNDGHVHDH